MIAPLAALAGATPGDARDQRLGRAIHHDDAVDLAARALLRELFAQRLGLCHGARKAVEQVAARGVRLRQAMGHDLQP